VLGLMESILASAHTWFLESYQQGPYGDLSIRLVEGIKGHEPEPVQVGEKVLGSYYPVTIEPHSRCVTIRFRDLRSLLTFTEGYDAEDPKMELGSGKFLRQVISSSFRSFIAGTTTAIDEFRGQYSEWLVWCEEQIFQVLSGQPPEVVLESRSPDFSIERGGTWSAS
jgi:hypothetical protein